jgi:hypothetical protein
VVARTAWLVLAVAACLDKPPPPGVADAPPGAPDAPGAADADRRPDADDTTKTVFVTFDRFTGDLGGVVGADSICQTAADGVGLDGVYRAWLSDELTNPVTRMTHHTGPYVMTTGAPIADNWDDLVDGSLRTPLNRTETGQISTGGDICGGGEVWTNTRFDGLRRSTEHCNGWNSSTGATSNGGNVTELSAAWTDSSACPKMSCVSLLPLYCFEQ